MLLGCLLSVSFLSGEPVAAGESGTKDGPDLVITSLSASVVGKDRVSYSYTVKNIGNRPVNLDGPTDSAADNVSVQAYVSQDTVFRNDGDLPAGGTNLKRSPSGILEPGVSMSGGFSANVEDNPRKYRYLILMVDWRGAVNETDESNNLAVAEISNGRR